MRARWDSLLKTGESFYVVDWITLFFEYLIQIDFSACNDISLVRDLLH
jgi:hypothetical protein